MQAPLFYIAPNTAAVNTALGIPVDSTDERLPVPVKRRAHTLFE